MNKTEKRMQRLQGNFMFVFSCINQICFGWADAETNIKGAYWTQEKKIIVSFLILVIKWHTKFSADKCKVAYIYS